MIVDCPGHDAEDESEYLEILSLERRGLFNRDNLCQEYHQLPCVWGHSRCYPSSKFCTYDHLSSNDLRYCRNGIHLHNCIIAACQGMFKCPNTICLPMHKVCNGVKDCPLGEDEQVCAVPLVCPGMLKCDPGICVTQEYICDNISQCSNHDDEMFCDVSACPHNCTCSGDIFNCSGLGLLMPPVGSGVKFMDLSYNTINLQASYVVSY